MHVMARKYSITLLYTYIELVTLNNLWWRVVDVIMCLIVFIPFESLFIQKDINRHKTTPTQQILINR